MNISEMVKEGLRIARTSKALWLYGFFVGLGAMGSSGNNGHVPGVPPGAHVVPHALTAGAAALAIGALVMIAAVVFMYFVSAGALIEGVTRMRRGRLPTVRQGWRDGVAHWGVLFRIAVIYIAANAASLIVLAAPFGLALKFVGTATAVVLAIPAVLIAVPWLVTLYMWQAFASRIAVLENRSALDAVGKARLFLHGRLFKGVKLIVAACLGRLIVVVAGALVLVVAGSIAFGVLYVLGLVHTTVPVLVLATAALLPPAFILFAISGTTQSSIWTIGYLTEQGQ
ncbi:MAG: hypothetical protein WDM77_05900 [Steroidobacteraceae bacterium]